MGSVLRDEPGEEHTEACREARGRRSAPSVVRTQRKKNRGSFSKSCRSIRGVVRSSRRIVPQMRIEKADDHECESSEAG